MDWVGLTSDRIVVAGRERVPAETGSRMLTALYKETVCPEYPKFFKMDPLCRLGFVTSRLLASLEDDGSAEELDPKGRPLVRREDRALVICGCSGSLVTDRKFQATIQDRSQFFPSPAVFVYTLPNIVTGEIAIRNGWCGETSCWMMDEFSPEAVADRVLDAFADRVTSSVTGGWLECRDADDFESLMFTVGRGQYSPEQLAGRLREMAGILGIIH